MKQSCDLKRAGGDCSGCDSARGSEVPSIAWLAVVVILVVVVAICYAARWIVG